MDSTRDERREQKAVEYLRSQLDMDDPAAMLAVYKQIIEKKVFHTRVGYDFLDDLRYRMLNSGRIEKEAIPDALAGKPKTRAKRTVPPAPTSKTKPVAKPLFVFSVLLNVVLIVMVIVMFIITVTSDSPTIVNYRNELEDEYSVWDEDLKRREKEIKKKEAQLEQQKQELQQSVTEATEGAEATDNTEATGTTDITQTSDTADTEDTYTPDTTWQEEVTQETSL